MKKRNSKQSHAKARIRATSVVRERNLIHAEALRAKARLSKLFRERLGTKGRKRADVYQFLKITYKGVRRWMHDGTDGRIEEELRKFVPGSVYGSSSIYIVLLRAALADAQLPELEKQKMISNWAAALELAHNRDIPPEHFVGFVMENGGIEGAKRKRAAERRKEKDDAVRSPTL
jgi:hypothetical protein